MKNKKKKEKRTHKFGSAQRGGCGGDFRQFSLSNVLETQASAERHARSRLPRLRRPP